jgi:glyoxylase-like metal-dependent hydrolase (beta-lactamase superfamily II)
LAVVVWKVEVLLPGSWRGATSVLISNGRDHIIVDTGMPHEAHFLMKELEQRAIKLSEIRAVINTHFHVDHVLNNSLFPNSEIFASQQSYEWCRSLYSDLRDNERWEKLVLKYYPETFEYEKAAVRLQRIRKLALRWWDSKRLGFPTQFRWLETQAAPEGIESLITSGHVPGHVSVIVRAADQPTIIAGDALLSRDQNDQVLTMIPHNREQFGRDRNLILSMDGRIVPGHDHEFSTSLSSRGEPDSGQTLLPQT